MIKIMPINKKQINVSDTRIIVTPAKSGSKRAGFIARPLAVVEDYTNYCEAWGETREEAVKCLERILEDEEHLLDYEVDNIEDFHFDKPVFMGGGNRSLLKRQLLHDKIDHACMILAGVEQNGGMGTEFDEKEDKRSTEASKQIADDIRSALVYPRFNLEEKLAAYGNAGAEIFTYFDCGECWLDIEDHLDDEWSLQEGKVVWDLEVDDDGIQEYMYSADLRRNSILPKDNYTMVLARHSTGDKAALIFNNKLRIDKRG